jgi:alpha-acetolactate decarboxylase
MGKHKYIETPEKLKEYFKEYVKLTKSNPFRVQDYVGKDGNMVYRERERPLTFEGFCCYLRENDIINEVTDYFVNKNEKYSEYSTICHAIKEAIRRDQIEGGMVGIYNPSITQRLNGLVEKTENKTEIVEQRLFPEG